MQQLLIILQKSIADFGWQVTYLKSWCLTFLMVFSWYIISNRVFKVDYVLYFQDYDYQINHFPFSYLWKSPKLIVLSYREVIIRND